MTHSHEPFPSLLHLNNLTHEHAHLKAITSYLIAAYIFGDYRNKSALASAKYRKPSSDGNVCPKGIIFNTARLLEKTPANEISGFSDVIPDEAQQGPIPRQSLDMRLQERGVTRVHHSLIISSLLLCRSAWVQLDPVTL